MPELRKNTINSSYVIISSERGLRPNDYKNKNQRCPFCPGNEEDTPPEIFSAKDENGNWKIRVVSNKYPALVKMAKVRKKLNSIYEQISGSGIHEVVIETPEHNKKIEDLSCKDISEIFKVYAMRISALKKEDVKQVMVFKNYGMYAGASLKHPHSQIIALPVLSDRLQKEIENSQKYFNQKKRCPHCDIIEIEKKHKERIVCENENFIAFEPFASRFCFETWIMPKRHSINFEEDTEIFDSLALIFKDVMQKLSYSIKDLSYNIIIQSAPKNLKNKKIFHWRIEILPKLAMMAGFEWGSGFYINSISPEEAARILREKIKYKI